MTASDDTHRDPLTELIIGAAIEVNKSLGTGLLEHAYQVFLCHELRKRGLAVSSQPAMPVYHDGVQLEIGFRPDIIVQDSVVVELKTVTKIIPVHEAQVLTYLRFSGLRVGLLMNFYAMPFRTGIKRMVL